jgi:hypothetical protein
MHERDRHLTTVTQGIKNALSSFLISLKMSGGDTSDNESNTSSGGETLKEMQQSLKKRRKIEGPQNMSLNQNETSTTKFDPTGTKQKVNNFDDVAVSIDEFEGPIWRRNIRFIISQNTCSWETLSAKLEIDRVCQSITPCQVSLFVSGKTQ